MAKVSDIGHFQEDIGIFLEALGQEIARELTGPMVRDLGEGVARTAKSKLGEYQAGWAPLADSTKATRAEAGYPADEPLLVTGTLRSSIQVTVERRKVGGVAHVGSNAPQARIQELGGDAGVPRVHIPPRPYLAPALVEQEREIVHKVESSIAEAAERAAARIGVLRLPDEES